MRIPTFGASLTVNTPPSTRVQDLNRETYRDLAALAEKKDALAERLEKIQDQKDPLSLVVNVGNSTDARISSRANGGLLLQKRESEGLGDFVARLLSEAEAMAANLLTPEERKMQKLETARAFVNDLATPLTAGNFEFLSKAQSSLPSELVESEDGYANPSDAAKFRVGDDEYIVDTTTDSVGTTYAFRKLDDTQGSLLIEIDPKGATRRFEYWEGGDLKSDLLAVLRREENEDRRLQLLTWITRTKQAINAVKSLGVLE